MALLAATLAAAPAAAVIKVATYSGTVTYGYDYTGEFFAPDTVLTGKSFVAQYVYNTRVSGRSVSPGYSDEIFGGGVDAQYYGFNDPLLSSMVTIGGVTRAIDSSSSDNISHGGYAGVVGGVITNAGAEDRFNDVAQASRDNYVVSLFQNNSGGIPTSLESNFSITSPSYSSQTVGFNSYDYITGTTTHSAVAIADATTVTVTDAVPGTVFGAVPEPATWALVIGGFGAVGTAARRRRVALA